VPPSFPKQTIPTRIAALPSSLLFALIFLAVNLTHLTLLQLPYFWDEGGYYIPAALDFYHHGWLIPHFTNAHPPLPNVVLGTLWHLTGFHILATRLAVCAFAAAALLAVFRLTQRLLDPTAALAVTFLTAAYPIWFAQSTLAHADIFAAAFTLSAFALYLPQRQEIGSRKQEIAGTDTGVARQFQRSRLLPTSYSLLPVSLLFSLAALSKETSILQPATLAALELYLYLRTRTSNKAVARAHLRWLAALTFPLLPLIAWYAYHHAVTGFTFGNPEYLRYNATANLTLGHVFTSLRYRFLHLFWQRNIWLPILLALACLLLPRRNTTPTPKTCHPESSAKDPLFELANPLPPTPYSLLPTPCITLLILSNWLAFSILGGALLTRYLLPIYPLILLVCFATWRKRTRLWPLLTALTAIAFISALWLNPPTSFAPEDNLTYRDMIVVHQQAIDYVATHYPDATVLTAWPVAADLYNPFLGYVTTPIRATSIEDFTLPEIQKAAQRPGDYDTAIVFTTHFTTPSFRHWLLTHPTTRQGREFAATRDLTPQEIARLLHGTVIAQWDRHGEWSAVLRFPRSYDASTPIPSLTKIF
jgi:4-amino-4-deoxy-L-arabinose transferase-like glycosyltransferase